MLSVLNINSLAIFACSVKNDYYETTKLLTFYLVLLLYLALVIVIIKDSRQYSQFRWYAYVKIQKNSNIRLQRY